MKFQWEPIHLQILMVRVISKMGQQHLNKVRDGGLCRAFTGDWGMNEVCTEVIEPEESCFIPGEGVIVHCCRDPPPSPSLISTFTCVYERLTSLTGGVHDDG